MNRQFDHIYNVVYKHVTEKLKSLSPVYTYHCYEHTLDVLEQTQRIAKAEGIEDDESYFLLQMASLYHDTGFLFIYGGHEAKGCEIAKEELPHFGVTDLQLEKICGMIMATKIPQSPKNLSEEIICDADLDYLGRDDFEPISNQLYKEFLEIGFVKNYDDWMQKQINFFESHHYFTKSSQLLRGPKKAAQLLKLKTYQPAGK